MHVNTPSFEDAVTHGLAQWLTFVKHDHITRDLVVELTHDPGSLATQRIIRFADVTTVEDCWIDRDDGCMETLMGAHENETGSDFRYTLVTDQREITFKTGKRGMIYDI
jgi:hypothetical protein